MVHLELNQLEDMIGRIILMHIIFTERSDEGLEFYEYNLASNDTLKAFTVQKSIISNFSYSFSPDQTKLLLKKNSVKIWRHSSYGSYFVYDILSESLIPVN